MCSDPAARTAQDMAVLEALAHVQSDEEGGPYSEQIACLEWRLGLGPAPANPAREAQAYESMHHHPAPDPSALPAARMATITGGLYAARRLAELEPGNPARVFRVLELEALLATEMEP